jgi:CRISPR-associated endonuclease/helicase Cas3
MLTPSDFPQFFAAVHQDPNGSGAPTPFPWQQALVERIYHHDDARTAWPEIIDVPTGLGKTAVLDVAVFLAAARPPSPYRRIFFVVDRRIVVDEAHDHAKRIATALDKPADPVTAAVAQALKQPGDDEGPVLEVARMRGGVTWDARWVDRPDRYAIVTGTVDQIGSRLLFRGYGVTAEARPIDAALVGTDSLIIVDEAHLAEPLLETINALRELDHGFATTGPTIVRMSATHAPGEQRVHTISAADEAHPVAGPRLRAPKTLHLVEARTTRAAAATAVPDALARLALALAGPDRVVGVVANTVDRARAVFERVRDKYDAVLLTGRSRPVDREYLLGQYYDRVKAGRAKAGGPFVLVATQTIEVGADIDLDALVTESAPLASLVQRLGRLNRRGRRDVALALVVHDTSVGEDDPVYGPARAATWNWLKQRLGTDPVVYSARLNVDQLEGGLDVSPLALRILTVGHPPELRPRADYVPVLPRATLDAWVRTSPAPHPDPPIEPFLHGITDAQPSVRLVWRIGLPNSDVAWAAQRGMPEALSRLPTTAEEELEVPLVAVRRWLKNGRDTPLVSDQDAEAALPADESDAPPRATRYRDEQGRVLVLRVVSRDEASVIPAEDIAPGDLIVVPVEYGGCDRFGWNPTSTESVVDVADLASRRERPALRIGPHLKAVVAAYHPALADDQAVDDLIARAKAEAEATEAGDGESGDLEELLKSLCDALSADPNLPLARNLREITKRRRRTAVWGEKRPWYVEITLSGRGFADDGAANASSVAHRRIRLDRHQRAVANRAAEFARNLGLDALVECVELAALLHDEGKRDPRFQAMLWGGDPRLAEIADHLLAKSGMDPSDRAARRRAQIRAGYPVGLRHEALSAQIAAHRARSVDCADPDLVVHLVAAHHGHSRPLLPAVSDPAPQIVAVDGREFSTASTVDWESPARFARLNERYGRWGLARLETIVRLADIWCSARHEGAEEHDSDV